MSVSDTQYVENYLPFCRKLYPEAEVGHVRSRRLSRMLGGTTLLKGLLATILVAMIASSPGYCQEVIVNPGLGKEGLKLNALRAIFSMRLRAWSDGTPVKVFVLSDDALVHVSFSKKKLQIFPHQLRYAWDRLVYSGTGQAPIKVGSEEEMRKKVSATPGAIGYLPEDLIDESVHVLHIQ